MDCIHFLVKMAATMVFQIGTETVSRSYDVSDASKNTSITKIVSALKEMRQSTDHVLNRFVEAEKIAANNENVSDGGTPQSKDDDEDDDDDDDDRDESVEADAEDENNHLQNLEPATKRLKEDSLE
ncbi:uncharacterized protein LOC135694221 [Rhopilema esculentum]|uniref:uncharacterized protein LOC135694221 n=1 Tax=Rhopilema esculentum TaxID=499914 RepID=UPI0031CE4D3D